MLRYILCLAYLTILLSCVHTNSSNKVQKSADKGGGSTRAAASTDSGSQCAPLKEKYGWPLDFSKISGLENATKLDIYSLQNLALNEHFEILNYIYNCKSVRISRLPSGYSAGRGKFGGKLLTSEIDLFWHGKIFFNSRNPKITLGKNRIHSFASGTTVPMANFVSRLVEEHPLVPDIETGANVVVLNYARSKTPDKTFVIEKALQYILVYDVMVAIEGEKDAEENYLFVGKTWKGKYATDGAFTADNPNELFAWYFLDFRKGAVEAQKRFEEENRLNTKPAIEEILAPLPSYESEVEQPGAFRPHLSEPGI